MILKSHIKYAHFWFWVQFPLKELNVVNNSISKSTVLINDAICLIASQIDIMIKMIDLRRYCTFPNKLQN